MKLNAPGIISLEHFLTPKPIILFCLYFLCTSVPFI